MTETEFASEIDRLKAGTGRDVHFPVVDAMFELYGHLPRDLWHEATTVMLVEGRWPNSETIGKALNHAREKFSKQGVRATASARPCDCGGYYHGQDLAWVYLNGHFEGSLMDGAVDRIENQHRWAAMHRYACDRCHGVAYLAVHDARSGTTGRKVGAGEFVVAREDHTGVAGRDSRG